MCSFDYTTVAGSREVGPVNRSTTPVFMTVVTLTDRSKPVSNCCVIEMLVAFLCCHFTCLTFLLLKGFLL